MWTPKELEATYWVETAWWRILRFFADGTVSYALYNEEAGHDVRTAAPKRLDGAGRRAAQQQRALGTYSLSRGVADVTVELPHGRVGFVLTLADGARGRFNRLILERHTQSEPGGGPTFDHRVPEDQGTFFFVAVPAWT